MAKKYLLLVIDDSKETVAGLNSFLSQSYDVLTAYNGLDGGVRSGYGYGWGCPHGITSSMLKSAGVYAPDHETTLRYAAAAARARISWKPPRSSARARSVSSSPTRGWTGRVTPAGRSPARPWAMPRGREVGATTTSGPHWRRAGRWIVRC